ncbi:RnfABCDGE type electron transport complex subunit G [Vibrio tritonius]|uniref:Ion-translocating oxidoreductase complex subunit G n=1 Tax=Vibrio tritonius TaxID=1435069 RepID=A0ABS7YTF6_9VIBR|nr:RnfABCDGE type electron transport complex subunit G [Vibrio tritonius]MCA2018974.1 RnfABCDGE type electron transport complex subunit G [Vibrio tritonius]
MMAQLDQWKDKVSYQSGLLAATCALATLLLVGAEIVTKPVIEQRIREDQNTLLQQVLGSVQYANDVFADGHSVEYQNQTYQLFPVKDQTGKVIDWVVQGSEDGYSGPIQYLMGVNMHGEIIGVRIVSHTETPGLGDKIELAKSPWVLGFDHHSLANTPKWGVKKDGGTFDQFSGATITPRAVVKGIHLALLALQQDQQTAQAAQEANNE